LAALDIEIARDGQKAVRHRSTRAATPIASSAPDICSLATVTVDGSDYLLARSVLTKPSLLDAIQASLQAAPPLKRWLDWQGEAIVSAIDGVEEWFARSRPPRLLSQEQRDPSAPNRSGGGSGQSWKNQPPDSVKTAMGIASEWLAREYLRRRYPNEMSDLCWVSSNRAAFCTGSIGDDSLGYDFRVLTERNEWLFEVKSAIDAGGEFELSARELEVAGSSCSIRLSGAYCNCRTRPPQARATAIVSCAAGPFAIDSSGDDDRASLVEWGLRTRRITTCSLWTRDFRTTTSQRSGAAD
jgi:Domain of unknown function (DUF3883)